MNTKKRVGPPAIVDMSYFKAIEVSVDGSSREDFEHALRRFKMAFQRERIVGLVKEKMAYEKPSEKKRRKRIEARDKRLQAMSREAMIKTGEWDRRQKVRANSNIRKEERNTGVFDE